MTIVPIAGAILLLIAAAILVIAGVWQIVAGRNLPGLLGWGYLPRHGQHKSATWRPWQWRRNGLILLILAVPIGNLGLMLLRY